MGLLKFLLLGVLVSVDVGNGQLLNYFGVAFSPYVKNAPFPNWDTYTIDEIKQMLRIILNKHNSVSTYGMGVASYNNGKPWDQCDSNALIARAAGQINKEYSSVVLSISQGIYQQDDPALQSREIDNAFSAAIDANNLQPGTVWGLTFTNEFVTDGNNGPKVLQMIRDNKARAHGLGLKVGPRVHTCGEIWGGNNQNILTLLAQESDFIMCNMYPSQGANPETGVQQMKDAYFSARDGFWKHNDKLEVLIGETGWASEGETFNGLVNTIENERRFWDGMKSFANSENVKIQMFQAFDEQWKTGLDGEKHFGWWYRPNNNEAKYIEKSTGQVYE